MPETSKRPQLSLIGDQTDEPLIKCSRILLTDDDPVYLEMAEQVLAQVAEELLLASDGAEALEILQREACDIAIVDLSMPKIDGFRLVAYIRNMPAIRNLPIIVVSTRDDHKALEEAHNLGVNLFLTKPLNWSAFPYQVSSVLRSARGAAGNARGMAGQTQPDMAADCGAGPFPRSARGHAISRDASYRSQLKFRRCVSRSAIAGSSLVGYIRR